MHEHDDAALDRVILAALEQTRSAACITTADLDPPGPAIVYVNPAYCQMTGRSRESVIGLTPRIMQGPLTSRVELDRLRAALGAGRSFEGETVNYRADGTPFLISWRVDPVRDETGSITHFVATQEDVTEQRRARHLLAAEQLLDESLTRALRATVDSDDGVGIICAAIVGGVEQIVGAGDVSMAVIIEGRPVAVAPAVPDRALSIAFERPESLVEGTVWVDGLSDEALAFVDRPGLERFTERAAAVIAALVEYQRQRTTAIRLQRDLLPATVVDVSGFDVGTRYLPGSFGVAVGGDWYDATDVGDAVFFSVGDASGNGVDAAALMGRVRLLIDTELARGGTVVDALELADDLCRTEERLATVVIAECTPDNGSIRIWSAGHPPPVVFGPAEPTLIDVVPAPPLGHLDGRRPSPTDVELEPGSALLMYTDGLVERRDESLSEGLSRLTDVAMRSGSLDRLLDDVLELVLDQPNDDVALLAIRPVATSARP